MKKLAVKYLIRINIICFCLFWVICKKLHAQRNDAWVYSNVAQSVPVSPEAASIARYGAVPVNLFSGVPNISVPIYNIELSDFSFPINVNYNAGGLRVSEVSSNVGLGWSLNAGGLITISVKGKPDIDPITKRIFPAKNVEDFNPVYDAGSGDGSDYTFAKNAVGLEYDMEQDIYYYNFCGNSGKFVFNRELTKIYPIPYNNYQISYAGSNTFQNRYFTIKDDKGVLYEFKNMEHSTISEECSLGVTNPRAWRGSLSTSFYLSRIVTPNKNIIEITYDTIPLHYVNDIVESRSIFMRNLTGVQGCGGAGGDKYSRKCSQIQHIQSRRIKNINCNNGELIVLFEYAIEKREDIALNGVQYGNRLKEIVVKSDQHQLKKYTFEHDYFRSPGYDSLAGMDSKSLHSRLKLISIKEEGLPPHLFSYNEDKKLPYRLSFARDLWGYYNGMTGNPSLIPKSYFPDTNEGAEYGANRESDANSLAWLLKRHVYPTHGYTDYEYENHNFMQKQYEQYEDVKGFYVFAEAGEKPKMDSGYFSPEYGNLKITFSIPTTDGSRGSGTLRGPDNYIWHLSGVRSNQELNLPHGMYYILVSNYKGSTSASVRLRWSRKAYRQIYTRVVYGGARIKKISDYDITGLTNTREFTYTYPDSDTVSSIQRYGIPYPDRKEYIERNNRSNIGQVEDCLYRIASTSSGDAISDADNAIGYKWVGVYEKDGTSKRRTYYRFSTNLTDFEDVKNGANYSWARGIPLETRYDAFDTSLKNYKTVKQDITKFRVYHDPGNSISNPLFPDKNERIIPNLRISQRVPEMSNVATFPAEFIVETYPTVSAWFMPVKTETRYLDEFNVLLERTDSICYDNSVHAQPTRIFSTDSRKKEITKVRKYPHDKASIPNLTTQALIAVDSMLSRNMSGFLLQEETYVNKQKISAINNNFKLFNGLIKLLDIQTTVLNNPSDKEIEYLQYDDRGNILEFIGKNGIRGALIWGYNKLYPVAKIEGASYSNAIALLNMNIINDPSSDQQLRQELLKLAKLQGAFVSTFTYKKFVGPTSITDSKWNTIYYEYDALGRLILIKDNDNKILKRIDYQYQQPVTQ